MCSSDLCVLHPQAVKHFSGQFKGTSVPRLPSDGRRHTASGFVKHPVQVGYGNYCCDRQATEINSCPVTTVVGPFDDIAPFLTDQRGISRARTRVRNGVCVTPKVDEADPCLRGGSNDP